MFCRFSKLFVNQASTLKMVGVLQEYFETSSIAGFGFIARSRRCSRVLWLFIVFTGFTMAGVMIYQAFRTWADSPIATVVETLPISEIRFPKITVCPPRNTFTNLNYDLVRNGSNSRFDKKYENIVKFNIFNVIQNNYFNELMDEMSLLEFDGLYRSWYNIQTLLKAPFRTSDHVLKLSISTSAFSGAVKSKDFGTNLKSSVLTENSLELVVRIFHPNSQYLIPLSNFNQSLHNFVMNITQAIVTEGRFEAGQGFDDVKIERKNERALFPISFIPSPKIITLPTISSSLKILNSHYYRKKLNLQNLTLDEADVTPGFLMIWNITPTAHTSAIFAKRWQKKCSNILGSKL